MNRIIRRKQGDPISSESMEEIRRLTEMPDELINTDDIPERPVGAAKRVYLHQKLQSSVSAQRKAS